MFTLFKNQTHSRRKTLKEEKLLIQILREECLPEICTRLLEPGQTSFSEEEKDEIFNLFLQELREKGKLQEILNEYLRRKIRRQQMTVGAFNNKHP